VNKTILSGIPLLKAQNDKENFEESMGPQAAPMLHCMLIASEFSGYGYLIP